MKLLSTLCISLVLALTISMVPAFAQQGASSKAALPIAAPTSAPSIAPQAPVGTVETVGQTDAKRPVDLRVPHDLSPWSMFMAADILVKAVMLGLLFASLVTWTILFGKTVELGLARRRLRKGLARTDAATSFAEAKIALGPEDGFLGGLVAFATREVDLGSSSDAGIKERCESRFSEMVRAEVQGMRRGMGLLATIGATAPFVGLFGTVWGIMNAFIGISKAQTTNLAVVAPGIAEALLATAIGLVAAIPAVIIYNHFSQAMRRYQFLVARASGLVQRLLSRELDRRRAGMAMRAAK